MPQTPANLSIIASSARGRLAAALATIAISAFVGTVAGGLARAQDPAQSCWFDVADISELLVCHGRGGPPRPLDRDDGQFCAHLDGVGFIRPANGRRILGYGQRSAGGATSKGVAIEVEGEAPVVSPIDAVVTFAGEFRSYGRLLVLEPGCGLHFIMAGMAKIDVNAGQAVLAGEPIASMGQGSAVGRPVLYVELRRNGRIIDPGPDISGQ